MTLVIHTLLSALVAGTAVTVALVTGVTSALVLLAIAGVGLVATWPISHKIAKVLMGGGE